MMSAEQYRNLVIGSGEAGKFLAWTLAKRGEKTVIVERWLLGGACPNVACLPSKNVIHSAKAVSLADPVQGLGVLDGQMQVNMANINHRRQRMVDDLIVIHHHNFNTSGCEVVMGNARFVDDQSVEVVLNDGGTRIIQAERIFINVGTRATVPNVAGLLESSPLTHVEALKLETVPKHLVVLGGGYVGLEFAQAMRRFGAEVTVIHRGAHLLDHEDSDVAVAIAELMNDEGINVHLSAQVNRVTGKSGEHIEIQVQSGESVQTISASHILVSAGRSPNTDGLGVANAHVELGDRGYIRVDETLQTTNPKIWAMGDCAGTPHFTHASFDDFRVVLDRLDGGNRTTTNRLIPYCLFTDPELAHVGLSEKEATAKGIEYRLFKIPMASVLRTRTLSNTRGFCKALVGNDDRILGFTAFGAEASEMMAVVQTAILAEMTYQKLRSGIFTHPTAAEGLIVLFSSMPATPKH